MTSRYAVGFARHIKNGRERRIEKKRFLELLRVRLASKHYNVVKSDLYAQIYPIEVSNCPNMNPYKATVSQYHKSKNYVKLNGQQSWFGYFYLCLLLCERVPGNWLVIIPWFTLCSLYFATSSNNYLVIFINEKTTEYKLS